MESQPRLLQWTSCRRFQAYVALEETFDLFDMNQLTIFQTQKL